MKHICQRDIVHLYNLEDDLLENIIHYKETGQDGDLIDSVLDQMMAIIRNTPDIIPEKRIEPDPEALWVYSPQNPTVHYGRFGHLVHVVGKQETGRADSKDEPVYVFQIRFTDGYEALAYEDELEEV